MSLRQLARLARHPRTLLGAVLTYPRFLGTIKPKLMEKLEGEQRALLAAAAPGWWPARLEAPLGRRILAISPHADDETIGAGGLLLAHRDQAAISVITLFDGGLGGALPEGASTTPDEHASVVELRRVELAAACRHFSGRIAGALDLADGTAEISVPMQQRFRRLVEEAQPDVVVIPWFLDGHADHRTANRLWAATCADLDCMVLGSEIWSPHVMANAYFDITELLPAKLDAIREFKSQLETVDYLGLAESLGRMRGYYSAARERRTGAAEAFFALPNRDYCELVGAASA